MGHDAVAAADKRKAEQRYDALVAAGKGVKLWDEALTQQIFLRGPEFIARTQTLANPDAAAAKDSPQQQRRESAQPIQYCLDHHKSRDAGIIAAVRDGQHRITNTAAAIGLSVSRVSRIVKSVGKKARSKA